MELQACLDGYQVVQLGFDSSKTIYDTKKLQLSSVHSLPQLDCLNDDLPLYPLSYHWGVFVEQRLGFPRFA